MVFGDTMMMMMLIGWCDIAGLSVWWFVHGSAYFKDDLWDGGGGCRDG